MSQCPLVRGEQVAVDLVRTVLKLRDPPFASAAFRALVMLSSREAKKSFSWIFTRSHGGFPMTHENPPDQPELRIGTRLRGAENMGKLQIPVEESVVARQTLDGARQFGRGVGRVGREATQDSIGDGVLAGCTGLRLDECGAPGVGDKFAGAVLRGMVEAAGACSLCVDVFERPGECGCYGGRFVGVTLVCDVGLLWVGQHVLAATSCGVPASAPP